jgi:hypothetical protein
VSNDAPRKEISIGWIPKVVSTFGSDALDGPKDVEPACGRPGRDDGIIVPLHLVHGRARRPLSARRQHGLNRLVAPRENRLDGAVAAIPHPAVKASQFCLMLHPGAKAYALNPAVDQGMDG